MSSRPTTVSALGHRCPACDGNDLRAILSLEGLPVHGAAVFASAEAARAIERGEQNLSLCLRCGVVFNTAFDESLLDYSGHHETSQQFSPHFMAYCQGIAAGWVERFGLRGAQGCEIGAGSGDFLAVLLDAGVDRIVAVDPALDAESLPVAVRERVVVHRDLFNSKHLETGMRFVCMRHTLEHIHRLAGFLHELTSGMQESATPLLLNEVPDLGRILESGAFWDLQYEHCSYFTPRTLLTVLAGAGFERGEARLTYGDQYIVSETTLPSRADLQGGPLGEPALIEPMSQRELEMLASECETFASKVSGLLARWGEWFASSERSGREVVIWGGGAKCVMLLSALEPRAVTRVVDINPGLQGHYVGGAGVRICAPAELQAARPDEVLLMNPVYRDEVRRMLDSLGLEAVGLTAMNA